MYVPTTDIVAKHHSTLLHKFKQKKKKPALNQYLLHLFGKF